MVKVLHVLGTLNLGGAESRIIDLYRHMDRDKVQFDFLIHTDSECYYNAEVRKLGGHIYSVPRFKGYNYVAYKRAMREFFEEHHDYSVVQGHMTSTAAIYLPIAKAVGLAPEDDNPGDMIIDDDLGTTLVTVAHTRNAGVDKGLKGMLVKKLRKSLPQKADFLFACSHLAGDETFGGAPYTYIPNTIDTDRFTFNPEARDEIRDVYDIPSDAIVIGNVARFSPQKNQKFLIDAFWELCNAIEAASSDAQVYLMLCGDGKLKSSCEDRARELKILDRVIFTGNQSEVQDFYSAMDIFAFPSIYEGLPGVVVEAQTSGLQCLISDTITPDVLITDRIDTLGINVEPQVWANKLIKIIERNTDELSTRADFSDVVKAMGFDVGTQADKVMAFYMNPCKENLPI